jgi:hypothetical protein
MRAIWDQERRAEGPQVIPLAESAHAMADDAPLTIWRSKKVTTESGV